MMLVFGSYDGLFRHPQLLFQAHHIASGLVNYLELVFRQCLCGLPVDAGGW